jgi:hypothetical protein
MREQEVRELYEAYLQVHQPQEEVEQLDEEAPERITKRTKNKRLMKDAGPARLHNPVKEETDLFDTILEHLVAEGYADTNEAALAIMANMSEEWRQSIVENRGMAYSGGKPGASGDGSKPKGITGGKTYQMPGFDDDSTKKPKLKGV